MLSDYEKKRQREILTWLDQPPGLVARGFGRTAGPLMQSFQKFAPDELMLKGLQSALAVAEHSANLRLPSDSPGSVIELEGADGEAKSMKRNAMLAAGAQGVATGAGGALAMAIDIPALLTQSLRAIIRIAAAYGFHETRESPWLLGTFALASANTHEEKQTALVNLGIVDSGKAAVRDGLERAAEREVAKDVAVYGIKQLASQIGLNLGKRKALGAIPVVGAVVGGSVNAWYLHDVCRTSSLVYARRWLCAHRGEFVDEQLLTAAPGHSPNSERKPVESQAATPFDSRK